MRSILIIGVLFTFFFQAIGQKSSTIWDIRITSAEGIIEITYDLKSKHPVNNIDLKVKTSSGLIIEPKEVSGDIGKSIDPGDNKKIIWNVAKENRVFDENIDVIIGLNHFNGVSINKHFWSSAFYPGAGDYKLANKSHYFLYGLVGYGSIGASIYFNFSAANNYNRYLSSYNHIESEKLFQQAKVEQAVSWAFIGAAAAVWVADLTSVLVKSSKIKKAYEQNRLTQQQSKFYYNKMNDFTEHLASGLVNTKSKHDILVEEGTLAFNKKDYNKAKEKLEEAVKLKPDSDKAKYWLLEAKKKMEQIALAEKRYNQLIFSGDSLYNEAKQAALLKKTDLSVLIDKYEFAIKKYEEARSLSTNNLIHISKINRCEDEIELLNEEILKAQIQSTADSLFSVALNENKLEKKIDLFNLSISKYKELKSVDPSNTIAKNQIAAISDMIYDIQVKKILSFIKNNQLDEAEVLLDNIYDLEISDYRKPERQLFYDQKSDEIKDKKDQLDYNERIAKADVAFKNKEYDKAKKYYQEALMYKPNETYATDQLALIDQLTKPVTLFPTNDWTLFKLWSNSDLDFYFECKKGKDCLNMVFKYAYSINIKTNEYSALSSLRRYIVFTVDYIDCNGMKYYKQFSYDIHNLIEVKKTNKDKDPDFKISTLEIITQPYNIKNTDTPSYGTGIK